MALGQRQVVQRQVAEAEATLGRAEPTCTRRSGRARDAAVQGLEIPLARKLKMQLATSHAVTCAAQAVELVHAAAGTSAMRNESKFQQYFRDVHTITRHAFVSASR